MSIYDKNQKKIKEKKKKKQKNKNKKKNKMRGIILIDIKSYCITRIIRKGEIHT